MTIRNRVLLALVMTSVAWTAGMGTAAYLLARQAVRDQVLQHLDSVAAVQKNRVEAFLRASHDRVALVANRIQLRAGVDAFLKHRHPADLERVRQTLREAPQGVGSIRSLSVVGLDGTTLASTGHAAIGGPHPSTEAVRKGRRGISADTLFLGSDGQVRAWLSGPLDLEGALLGVVILEVDLSELLRDLLDYSGLGQTGETNLVRWGPDGSALFLIPSRFDPAAAFRLVASREQTQRAVWEALAGRETTLDHQKDYRGHAVLAATRWLPGPGWGLVVKMDREEALAPLRPLLRALLGISSLLVLTAFLLAARISRSLLAREMARRESEAHYRDLFENATDFLMVLDPDGRILQTNRACREALGWSEEEAQGARLADLVEPRARDTVEAASRRVLSGESSGRFEAALVSRRGSAIEVEGSLSLRRQGDQRATLRCIFHDLSQHREVDRLKNDFISTVSHELRTPLTSIKSSLGLLGSGAVAALPPEARSLVEVAQRNTDRLSRLINDLLDIEKLVAGELPLQRRPIELDSLVGQALEALQPYAAERQVVLSRTERVERARVLGDPDRLMQALANLLSNAAKFSPAGGQVEVAVARSGPCLSVEVKDRGPGVPEELRPRLFQRFSQARGTKAGKREGTGLGLAITRAIVERHGGTIRCLQPPGGGSTFRIELPELVEAPAALPVPAGIPPPLPLSPLPGSRGRPRALVCEDDPLVVELLSPLLEAVGFDADFAPAAGQARRLLHERCYDALTLDLLLPGQLGLEFLRELRADPRTRGLPVIVVSVQADDAREEFYGGMFQVVDWIAKPIDPGRLVAALRTALGERGRARILHVEDDVDTRSLVAALLGELAWVSPASGLAEARHLLQRERYDLILLDLVLPDGRGDELLVEVGATPVVVFSAYEPEPETARRVAATLRKSRTSNERLLQTIRAIVQRPAPGP